jgi:hypothetical protein
LLFSRQAKEAKLLAKFQVLVTLQVLVNLLRVQQPVEVQRRERERQAEPAGE